MSKIDPQEIRKQVNALAESYGIDLHAYGNASPTKLIVESIIQAASLMQQTTKVAITERNPATAMEFRSMLGLAAITGLNPASMLTASYGKVKVQLDKYATGTVNQHAKLIQNGLPYYVVLPAESVTVCNDDELVVRQGLYRTQTFVATGEHLETFKLQTDNYVDVDSIEVTVDNIRLTVGRQLDDNCDCIASLDYDGNPIVMVNKTFLLTAGHSVVISYADCVGISGDNVEVGTYMSASSFIFNGDTDITGNCKIVVSEPIIGGTDFEMLYKDMQAMIMHGGKNNLIGSESQLLQYVSRFKQYAVQNTEVTNGVLVLYCMRNLAYLTRTASYWDVCNNLDITADDIHALETHVRNLDSKVIDLLVAVEHAKPEHCKLVVHIAGAADITNVMQEVEAYLSANFTDRCYEVGDLYSRLLQVDNVKQVRVQFVGNTNNFGSAVPSNPGNILVCTAADITIDGVAYSYGSYTPDNAATIADELKLLTETQIADNNTVY